MMADSRTINLSNVTLSSKDSIQKPDKPEEKYLTGLEGHGRIASLETLNGMEFSASKTGQAGSGTGAAATISTSSVANQEKRASKTFVWIERVLEQFYNGGNAKITAQDTTNSSTLQKMFNCEDEDEDKDDVKLLAPIAEQDKKVSLIDYEITPFDQPTMLNDEPIPMMSKMLSLKAKYQVNTHQGVNYELFVVKTPSDYPGERDLASRTKAHHREICFYNGVLPFLQEWANQQGVKTQFATPVCIYAKHKRPFDASPILLDEISNVESILILEDLRIDDFGKRHFVEGLSVDEAKAAIAQICKIHVASWAFHEQNGYKDLLSSPAHSPLEVAQLYESLVGEGLKLLKAHLTKEMPQKPYYVPILQKLRSLELRIHTLLVELMELPKHPAPICLIHMDFWCDNILFRQGENPPTPEATKSTETTAPVPVAEGVHTGTHELDSEAWRPTPFIPQYPSTLKLDEAFKATPDPSTSKASRIGSQSNNTPEAGPSSAIPKYLEYITDPAYACVDLKDTAYKVVQDTMNNLTKKLIIKDSTLECRIIDWQFFSYGSPTHDIAILMLTSLTPEIRRNNTEMLLKYYLQVFDSTADLYKMKAPFDLSCLRKQFKRSQLLAFLLLLSNMEIVLSDESTQERFIEVVTDLIADNII